MSNIAEAPTTTNVSGRWFVSKIRCQAKGGITCLAVEANMVIPFRNVHTACEYSYLWIL